MLKKREKHAKGVSDIVLTGCSEYLENVDDNGGYK